MGSYRTYLRRVGGQLRAPILSIFLGIAFVPQLCAGELKVTFVNMGVGDSVLVQTPSGKNILIDGGYSGPGSSVLIPYLKANGITSLDYLVATHRDIDHVGGLNEILSDSTFTVSYVISKDTVPINIGSVPSILLSTVTAPPAITLDLDPALTVKVLSARQGQNPSNNDSIVLKIQYGQVSFLLAGDIQSPVIDELVANFASEFPVTVLKVPHHGSNNSISNNFPSLVQPELAVISGAKDLNNNPDPDTLTKYQTCGIPVLRTDERGHISVRTNGISYSVTTTQYPSSMLTADKVSVHVYPNPAPGSTSPAKATVVYALNGTADSVRLAIYTMSGDLVRERTDITRSNGDNYAEWDLKNGAGQSVVSGLYIVQVEAKMGGTSIFGRAKMAVLR